jgi:DNA-binding transcriptional regulator YiaG
MAVMAGREVKYTPAQIKKMRVERDVSIKDAAELVGVNWRTWVGYERGEYELPFPVEKLIDLLLAPKPKVPASQRKLRKPRRRRR